MNRKLLPRLEFSPNRTLTSQIFEFMREQIVEKTITPGTPLSENDLATHFDVSRHPVREALNKLSLLGLIDILPQKGTFVSKISVNGLFEICFVRCAIECQAIRKSVNLDDKSFKKIIDRLEKCIDQQYKWLEKQTHNEKFLNLDDSFHSTICDFSQTSLAWNVLENVKANMDRIRYLSIGTFSDSKSLIDEHKTILEFIKNKQIEEACALIEKHAYEITHTYKPIMEENKEWFLEEN